MTDDKLLNTSLSANTILDQSLSEDQTYNIISWQTLFTWLWRWLPLRLLKWQSLTTVLFRTTHTLSRTITQYELLAMLLTVWVHFPIYTDIFLKNGPFFHSQFVRTLSTRWRGGCSVNILKVMITWRNVWEKKKPTIFWNSKWNWFMIREVFFATVAEAWPKQLVHWAPDWAVWVQALAGVSY